MSFIKVQKLVRNEDGSVRSGSAVIMDVVYVKDGKYHSKQVQREKLGKIVSLDPSKRRGVFMSPTRGLVAYDVDEDRFYDPEEMPAPKVAEAPAAEPEKVVEKVVVSAPEGPHKVFGDVYMALEALKSSGELPKLRACLSDDALYEGTIVRIMHKIVADGSRIPVKSLVDRSFVSEVFSKDAVGGGKYYHKMGSATVRSAIKDMLTTDRVPFYTDAVSYMGTKTVLVFDGVGGRPVGCEPVVDPGRWSLDHGGDGVAILNESYVTESLFKAYGPDSGMTFIAAMPTKKGFPYKDLCQKALKRIGEKECVFEKDGKELFAMRKKIDVFGKKAYAYVIADMGGYETPSPMFQVLISNKGGSPDLVADAYASGLKLEAACRATIPSDIPVQDACGAAVCNFVASCIQEKISADFTSKGVSLTEALGTAQSVMCCIGDKVVVEKAGSGASKMFKGIGMKIPAELSASEYKDSLMNPEES